MGIENLYGNVVFCFIYIFICSSDTERILLGTEEGLFVAQLAKDGEFD